jgi:hypothetical protein
MKKIIKSSFLFCSFFAFTNQIKAQLASDKPVAKVAVPVAAATIPVAKVITASSSIPSTNVDKTVTTEAKIVTVITASSASIDTTAQSAKKSVKMQVANPVITQGKEIVPPVQVTPAQLPTVSSQGVPPAKS